MDYAYAVVLMHYKGNYRSIPRALKYHADLAAGRHFGALLGRRIAAAPHLADIDLVIPVPLHWTRRRSRGYNQSEILARALTAALRSSPPRPVAAGHDENVPAPVSVTPGMTGSLPACRTDLLVRARRTRTQTRLSVDQKARNVAFAFLVPARFPLWHRLLARLAGRLLSLSKDRPSSRPSGACHDGAPRSRRLLSLAKDASEIPTTILASARHILLVDDTFTTGATLYACYAALRPYTTARISIATLAAVEGTPSSGP